MSKKRKQYSPEEKVSILRRHLLDGVPVSDLCDAHGIHPTMFYKWQKVFFEQGASAFAPEQSVHEKQQAKKIAVLEAKLTIKNEVLSELMEEHIFLKKSWGDLSQHKVSRVIRDAVIDFVVHWHKQTGICIGQFLSLLGLSKSTYYDWKARYGAPNGSYASLPKTSWLLDWGKQAIITYALAHPDQGYRRLAYQMIDENVVAVSPRSVYRVLKGADLLGRTLKKVSKKGTGFDQPTGAHQHWHVDVSYLNICGTFYYLCALLDGYSRFLVHFEIREAMREKDVEIIIQRGREKFPKVRPCIISDNGPQFIALAFKSFIRLCGMTHVRTSPFYPQSNGKIERWHQSLKRECIRPKTPTNLEEAREVVVSFVAHYNHKRYHASIGYIAPVDKLCGTAPIIFRERKCKLAQAKHVLNLIQYACVPNAELSNPLPICSLTTTLKIPLYFEPLHASARECRHYEVG